MPPVLETLNTPSGPVSLRVRANARRISLRLDHATREAELVIPAPRHRSRALSLLSDKQDWLMAQRAQLPPAMPFVDGGEIWLRGDRVRLCRKAGRSGFDLADGIFMVRAPEAAPFADRVRRALIALARADLADRVQEAALALDLRPGRISVRDTKSRWGSCTREGNLNFSWRLLCAPPSVLGYVAAHEVAHIRHPHHGPAFWADVERAWPNAKTERKALHEWAPKLFAIGAPA